MKKILVVDDEKECCQFLKDYFGNRGYYIDVAYDGLYAKGLLDKNEYDYIFFDCNMPEITGVELARIIETKNPKAHKVMISGYDLINEDFVKGLNIEHFLTKPLSLAHIQRIMSDG